MPMHFEKRKPLSAFQLFIIFAFVISFCCFLGIASRPLSFLAFFWPANSVLLGLLVRFPETRKFSSFLGAFAGYLFADFIGGTTLPLTLSLTTANLIYVLTALGLYLRFSQIIHSTHRVYSYLFLFGFCSLGSIFAALFAATAVPQFNTKFMLGSFWTEFSYWFTAELQNALLILPILLNFPRKNQYSLFSRDFTHLKFIELLPLFAVIISIVISYYDIGPGSLLYPIAALIWCALRYRPFYVALITTASCTFIIYKVSQNYLHLYPNEYFTNTISIRMGLIMLTIAPLTVSGIISLHAKLIQELKHTIAHDELTSSLTRRQFMQSVHLLQAQSQQLKKTSVFMMLDVDHFKMVNDTYGHAIGDKALQTCVNTIQNILRGSDLLGRLGGEEFAIFIADTNPEAALEIAERIRLQVSQQPIFIHDKTPIYIQISIGMSFLTPPYYRSIETLFKKADDALYQAKRLGRNQVYVAQ